MTKMKYTKTVTKTVHPTIVKLNLIITCEDKNASSAIDKLNDTITTCKCLITKKSSYEKYSYKQTNLKFRKCYKKKIIYVNKKIKSNILTKDEYDIAVENDSSVSKVYEKTEVSVFDKYEASTQLSAVLIYNDTVIQDFTDIMNMAIDKKINFTYDHNITDTEKNAYEIELFTTGVNSGLDEINNIVSKFKFSHDKVKIVSIDEQPSYGLYNVECSDISARTLGTSNSYVPETYLIPSLVKELFNNNIELTKSVDLYVEF